ncbi:hypothetical protein FJTKL_15193 [Diaporthe vaccinii]|uniref:Transcription factor domain-containing protein n=1 Tax=Diaporthe vaccinii TaxID=105482 RepID=A0ABR4E5R5_9PEZI
MFNAVLPLCDHTVHREKPIVCLAILFASSYDDGILQGRISRLFEQMLATALLQGRIASLENLQGLLIYTAWMQYQPRPRKHTQNIFLAMSIIYDMRFHKPRELPIREENGLVFLTRGLAADEVRALVGLYCVASCASVILDKFRCFPTIPLLAESCEAMAQRAEHPTDPYLPQIVGLLRMIEDVDGLAKGTTPQQRDGTSAARISHLQYQWQSLKKSLPAHAATSPFLRFQTRAAEFLLGEMSLPGSPFSLSEDPSTSLAETISAVKSLMDTLLSAEPDQELFFTNLAWVTLGYGLSLGVKLDILCTTCGISPATVIELRRSLDIAQTLRGLIERLRMSISQHKDTDAESHPLFQFLSRAEAVESILVRKTWPPICRVRSCHIWEPAWS